MHVKGLCLKRWNNCFPEGYRSIMSPLYKIALCKEELPEKEKKLEGVKIHEFVENYWEQVFKEWRK